MKIRKSMSLILALIMIVGLFSFNVFAEEKKDIKFDMYPILDTCKFKDENKVKIFYDENNININTFLTIDEDTEADNEIEIESKFDHVLGYEQNHYIGEAMEMWIPDEHCRKDDERIKEQFNGSHWDMKKYQEEQLKIALEKWNKTDWDLENSYYQIKIKLPENMIFDKNNINIKWCLDEKGESKDDFLKQIYEPQEPIINGNTIIFRTKFKSLQSDLALNTKSEHWNKKIAKLNLPIKISYKKGDSFLKYEPEIEHGFKLVDKSNLIKIEGSSIQGGPMSSLYPMDLGFSLAEKHGGLIPLNQNLYGDISSNNDSESNNYFLVEKEKLFDIDTKLDVSPIKKIVSDPFDGLLGGKAFNQMPIFRFWPALNLDSYFYTTLRFPKEIIVPENLDSNNLKLVGANNVFYISQVDRDIDPSTGETILKVHMPLTQEAKEKMPSLYDLSNLISSVDSDFYLKIPGLKLSDNANFDTPYTVEGKVGGKVFFTFITDIDDWVASEYQDELKQNFGNDIIKAKGGHTMAFNDENPNLNSAIDYMLEKHPEIFSTTIPNLLTSAELRRKYDTNIYSLLVNWSGKQEESGRDCLFSLNDDDPDSITFTLECKQVEPQPSPLPDPKIDNPSESYSVFTSEKTPEKEAQIHQKYIFGYPDDTIRPEGNMTRAEAIAVVARLEKLKLEDFSNEIYSDTEKDAWYNKAINAAYKAGFLEEKKGEKIRPNDKITRAELAQLISHIDSKNDAVAPFEDIKGHKYEAAINMAYGNERIKGYPDATFRPDAEITRAEVATMLNKLYNRYPDEKFIDTRQDLIHTFKDMPYKEHWAYYDLVEAYETHKFHRLYNNLEEWIDIIK